MTDFVFKVILAGDGGVGKTTLLNRYISNQFIIDMKMTIGVDILKKTLKIQNEIECDLQLWDFGGQDRFRFLLDSFVVGAKGAFVVFDLTQMTSFNHIEEWVNIVRKNDRDLPLVLIGTKADLDYKISVDEKYVLEELEKHKFIDYIKTSSKTGLNVEVAFEILTVELLRRSGKEFLTTLKRKYDFFSSSIL